MNNDEQQSLFDTRPPQWELDEDEDWLAARVVFSEAPHGPFDYLVPDSMRDSLTAGKRVRVPIGRGNRKMRGYCVAIISSHNGDRLDFPVAKLKPVDEVLDPIALIRPELLSLAKWISDYYLCPLGTVIETMVPAGVRGKAGTREVTYLSVPNHVLAKITKLKLPEKQASALSILAGSARPMTPSQLAASAGCTIGPINSLRKKELVDVTVKREQRDIDQDGIEKLEDIHTLSQQQVDALESINRASDSGKHETLVLHGITGSGKTEVYIRAIEHVVSFGRQAIVLVPEISLTPQTKHRFRERFEHVAVMHSHLSDSERHWHWQRVARGEIQVVVGARSAIFAPLPNLGIVVIDEEHDHSFKQDKAPRYHARDVAIQRAKTAKVPLILGSATPALETYQATCENRFRLIDMPTRVSDFPLPDVTPVDLRGEFASRQTRGAISRKLHVAMRESLESKGQVILLLNRRGFATSIQCPACGFVLQCPDCDLALTHHKFNQTAVCHYCDFSVPAPSRCTQCDFEGIKLAGLGTQKLEQEVVARFPDHVCLRMDSDSMQKPGSHEEALAKFRRGEVDILVGTQMIAKGLDFPNVTLVGVVNADTALHFPDYRAAERTFQLVTQVAGRTGRGEKGGRVFVQTYSPEHPAIQAATHHDFLQFAGTELPVRKEFQYPPYTSMARIVVRGEALESVEQYADHLADRLEKESAAAELELRIMGPAPAPIAKLRGLHRFHMLFQFARDASPHAMLKQISETEKTPETIQWIIDIDPIDML